MAKSGEEIAREVAGYVLLVAALLAALAIVSYHPRDPSPFAAGSDEVANLLGRGGAVLAGVVVTLAGVLALGFPVLLAVVGWLWLRGRTVGTPALQASAWSAALVFGGGLLAQLIGRTGYRGSELEWGGELGRLVAAGLNESLGLAGCLILCSAGLIAGVALGVRGSLGPVGDRLERLWGGLVARRARRSQERERSRQRGELVRRHTAPAEALPLVLVEREGDARFRIRRVAQVAVVEEDPEPSPAHETAALELERVAVAAEPARRRAAPVRRAEAVAVQEVFSFVKETPASALPEKSMLGPAPPAAPPDPRHLAAMRELIEAKSREFRVEGKVEDVLPGPIITTYEFRPAAGVKYAQVVALEDDLALGLQVEAVRIERIPGKATVGIEVPNPERTTIVLREIIESSKFVHSASPLTLALGKDIHGRPFVTDLVRMPHLLIGGFTGSGKSVGINAMIMSILFKAEPKDVRFILIDPKMVELGIYEKLPHLLTPIITEPKEAARALRWAVRQMRERYALLASCKVRNLQQYNALVDNPEAAQATVPAQEGIELKPLPYIVIMIDELADLMMTCAKEVEDSIGHLSQMARAVGIHLIFATQRPSVDVVTGVIKANFPCRVGYKVRTRFDSRTILDTEGAECLLGNGDMLYLAPGTSRPIRLHGPLVREEEIQTVLKHLRRLGKPDFDDAVLAEPDFSADGGEHSELDDPMYEQAARLVVSSRKASASFIQRKLRLGYARSARLLDIMEQEGVIGPSQGSRGREVLVAPNYFGEVDATRGEVGDEED